MLASVYAFAPEGGQAVERPELARAVLMDRSEVWIEACGPGYGT